MTNNRKTEILNSMNSFNKETYQKKEVLPELLKLQDEVVEKVFEKMDHEPGSLKLYDAERYLESQNIALGNPADEELAAFKNGSKRICNAIKAEISGDIGEEKVFRRLERIHSKNYVLKNVELQAGGERSELDAVVFTPKAIFIVEVKNTRRNIFIDEEGNYYKTGEYTVLHSNVATRLETKEELLRSVISEDTEVLNIQKLLVFTNNRIEIHNRNKSLNVCFLGQLPYIIDEYVGEDRYSDEQLNYFYTKVAAANHVEAYPVTDIKIDQFKNDFATLVDILDNPDGLKKEEGEKENGWLTGWIGKVFGPKRLLKVGTEMASLVAVITTLKK